MAIIRVEIAKRDQATREAIIEEITAVMVKYGAHSEGTQVIITEIEMTHWGKGGASFARRSEATALAAADAQGDH